MVVTGFFALIYHLLICFAGGKFLYFNMHLMYSLAVVENLRGKCKGEFVLSFSESVHPIVPQKKIPIDWAWGIFFTAL